MLGINDFVIVIVVNSINSETNKSTDWFTVANTTRTAAANTIYHDTKGNYHVRSDIQKQAYKSVLVSTVRQAFGLTGTNFETHTPYQNGIEISLDSTIKRNTEVLLIKNGLNVSQVYAIASRHRILPDRLGS